ncbi:uncharacterized [Tachysurus ichikawai]
MYVVTAELGWRNSLVTVSHPTTILDVRSLQNVLSLNSFWIGFTAPRCASVPGLNRATGEEGFKAAIRLRV